MKARNIVTGAAIVGTVERVTATAKIEQDGFWRDDDGIIHHGHVITDEGVNVDWDSTDQFVFEGERMFLDADGEQVKESELELFDPNHVLSGRCTHYHGGPGTRCDRDATHVLYAPGAAKPVPGGGFCREHAEAPAAEYLEKLNQRWAVVRCKRVEDAQAEQAAEWRRRGA